MTNPSYPIVYDEAVLVFEFDSISDSHVIHKRIQYSPTDIPNLYNLALGDVSPAGILDDIVRSNNNDRDKIIATAFQTVLVFLDRYPERYIIFRGSTDSRTRLYRAVISRELDNALKLFDIYGVLSDQNLEEFNAHNQYIAFIITTRQQTNGTDNPAEYRNPTRG